MGSEMCIRDSIYKSFSASRVHIVTRIVCVCVCVLSVIEIDIGREEERTCERETEKEFFSF